MGCSKCEELLSDYLDGLLELGERAGVERHLAECSGCRILRDDLLQIIHFSRNLPLHTPSTAVWAGIHAQIEAGGVGSRWWPRVAERHFTFTARQLAVAAAALLLAFAATVFVARSNAIRDESGSSTERTADSRQLHTESISAAISEIEQRVGRLEANVEQRRIGWNADLQTAFDRQMLYVDQSLAECRQGLRANPYDEVCQDLMLTAYREKVRLLEGFSNY
jgi:hypothetical protein